MHYICSYSHIAFNVKDMPTMQDFYCNKLGMKEKFTVTTDEIVHFSEYEQACGKKSDKNALPHIQFAKEHPGTPLITYVEMAQNQFIELFYSSPDLNLPGDLSGNFGYQHLAIQVENLEDTWQHIKETGVIADTPITMGPDFTKQFWIHDPEGNRIEFMEYTPNSFQIVGNHIVNV